MRWSTATSVLRWQAIAFLGVDGQRLELGNDQAYVLVMSVASGERDDVEEIAARLR